MSAMLGFREGSFKTDYRNKASELRHWPGGAGGGADSNLYTRTDTEGGGGRVGCEATAWGAEREKKKRKRGTTE